MTISQRKAVTPVVPTMHFSDHIVENAINIL